MRKTQMKVIKPIDLTMLFSMGKFMAFSYGKFGEFSPGFPNKSRLGSHLRSGFHQHGVLCGGAFAIFFLDTAVMGKKKGSNVAIEI